MNAWIWALSEWLLDYAVLASLVLAAALALRWCFRDPARRVALAWGTWLGLAALPVIIALPPWPRIALYSSQDAPVNVLPVVIQVETESISGDAPAVVDSPAASPLSAAVPAGRSVRWPSLLACGWLTIAGLAVVWIAAGLWQTARLVRRSAIAPQWISNELLRLVRSKRCPQVRTSHQLSAAAAVGAVTPRILLPAAAVHESQRPIVRAALAHEWAHIRHGDLWLLALERLLVPLLAWQPLFWWLRQSVRLDLELLADAAAAGDEPIEYAEALVAWARTAGPAPAGLAALSLWESPHTLCRRVTMLLDPKRLNPSPDHRAWRLLLACAAAVLIGGLSLVTLRSQTADGQETARPAETDSASADKAPTMIRLQCVILEADHGDLAEVLPVEKRGQSDPETDITLHEPGQWQERLKILTAKKATTVLSRPQIQTLDGHVAHVQIGVRLPPPTPANATPELPEAAKPNELGLRVQLTPRLTLQNSDRHVALAFEAVQVDLKDVPEGPRTFVERKLAGKAVVPVDRSLIIANRPRNPDIRPLVLAVQAYVVQRGDDSAVAAQAAEPPATSEDLPRLVRQLQRQLAERTRQAEAQRDQSEVLRKQVADLKAQLDKLTAGEVTKTTTVFKLQHAHAADVATALRTLLEQAITLGSDPLIENIKVAPDATTNSLIVSGPTKFRQATSAIIARLDQPPAGPLTIPRAGPVIVPVPAPPTDERDRYPVQNALSVRRQQAENIAQAERETQLQLLKLDLQEAEIGLQAAHKDLERVRALQKDNAISAEEVAKHDFQVKAAEIKVMRVKIMLDGLSRQVARPPSNTVDGPMPPHNPSR